MKPVFVGGCPRSGTTLVGSLLGAHSRVVCVPEMPFKINLLRELPWGTDTVSVDAVQMLLEGQRKFHAWSIPAAGLGDGSGTSWNYRSVIENLVRHYAAAVGNDSADVWVDHTPFNIRQVNELGRAFPEARFVHVVRDGRAVAASLFGCDFGPNTIVEMLEYWPSWIAFGLAAEMRYPDRVFRLRYEELVDAPAETMRGLSEWLGLENEEGLGSASGFSVPAYSQRNHMLVGSPPDPTRAEAWRHKLSPRDVEIFEHEVGDLLESLGYSRITAEPVRRLKRWERVVRWRAVFSAPVKYARNILRFYWHTKVALGIRWRSIAVRAIRLVKTRWPSRN